MATTKLERKNKAIEIMTKMNIVLLLEILNLEILELLQQK